MNYIIIEEYENKYKLTTVGKDIPQVNILFKNLDCAIRFISNYRGDYIVYFDIWEEVFNRLFRDKCFISGVEHISEILDEEELAKLREEHRYFSDYWREQYEGQSNTM